MKTQIKPLQILLIVIVIGIVVSIALQASAREEPAKYLEERLREQNVPVAEIRVLQQPPLQLEPVVDIRFLQQSPLLLEIVVQSLSEDDKGMPEDAVNMLLVRHEVKLAIQKGYHIDGITRVLINKMGKRLFAEFEPLYPEKRLPRLLHSTVADEITEKVVREKINLYGLSLVNAEVTSVKGIQTLNLKISASSVEEANALLPRFLPSLFGTVPALNAEGSQIAVYKLEVRDQKGNILFNYANDLQFGHETWWEADGITVDW